MPVTTWRRGSCDDGEGMPVIRGEKEGHHPYLIFMGQCEAQHVLIFYTSV